MVLNIFIEHEHLCFDAVHHCSGCKDCSYFWNNIYEGRDTESMKE